MPSTPDQNRQAAQAFYDLMFNQCKPREAVQRYVGANYTQHNPHVADGKDDGKIVEHWDVLQVVPGEMKHANGMF
jgi:predicted SnoaL-like aldol condensation-catalyzing enzyme